MASGYHGDGWTNKPVMHDDRVSPLDHADLGLSRLSHWLEIIANF